MFGFRRLKKENFQTFNINIFPDESFEGEELSPRDNMEEISSICVDFVNNFDLNNGENLLSKYTMLILLSAS